MVPVSHGAIQRRIDAAQRTHQRPAVGQRLDLHLLGHPRVVHHRHHIVAHGVQALGRDLPQRLAVESRQRLGRTEAPTAAPGQNGAEQTHSFILFTPAMRSPPQ